MSLQRLQLTFAAPDAGVVVERALACGFLPDTPPSALLVDHRSTRAARPLAELAAHAEDLTVDWAEAANLACNRQRDEVYLHRAQWPVSPEDALAMLGDWPFEACTTTPLDPTWWPDHRSVHGWALLLKGNGHRLVSPRIVDRGPWRLLRDEANDVTLFQFHDIEANAEDALKQARPGHVLLEPVWWGGHYLSQAWVFRGSASRYKPTFYDASTRTSIILVQDRPVEPAEMGIAAGTKVHQIFPEPVEQVAFVFMDEAMASRQLPALWLHGLEVRTMTATGERRIDHNYQPPPRPEPPPWVRRLQP